MRRLLPQAWRQAGEVYVSVWTYLCSQVCLVSAITEVQFEAYQLWDVANNNRRVQTAADRTEVKAHYLIQAFVISVMFLF